MREIFAETKLVKVVESVKEIVLLSPSLSSFFFMVSRSYQNRLCGFGVDTLRFNPILHFTGWTHVSIFLNTWHACIHTITSA